MLRDVGAIATAERLNETDRTIHLAGLERSEPLLGNEQLLAHDQRLEVTADTGPVSLVGQFPRLAGGFPGAFLHSHLIDQVAVEERAREAASQAWELAHQRYRAGVGSYLEALVVRQQLLVSEQRLAALKASQVDRSIRLIQALGGGYRPNVAEHAPTAASLSPSIPTRF